MNITLRAGEKLYINGAVIRVDRKATIELLNDVTFLLENHVMQVEQATTPLRQVYFAVQVGLIDPGAVEAALLAFKSPAIVAGLKAVSGQIERSRNFEALKSLRALFPLEEREMADSAGSPKTHAA